MIKTLMPNALDADDYITLKQGDGGRATRALIQGAFLQAFATVPPQLAGVIGLSAMDDGGAVRILRHGAVLEAELRACLGETPLG